MGFRSTWIAVRGLAPDRVGVAGFDDTGERSDSTFLDTGWWAFQSGEWLIILGSGWGYLDWLHREQAEALSSTGEALFFRADDETGASVLEAFAAGVSRWAVRHHDVTEVTGSLPPEVAAILAEQRRRQGEAPTEDELRADHLYEVPHLAGEAIVAFRHDGDATLPVRRLQPRKAPAVEARHGPWQVRFYACPDGRFEAIVRPRRRMRQVMSWLLAFEERELVGVTEHDHGDCPAAAPLTFSLTRGNEVRLSSKGLFRTSTEQFGVPSTMNALSLA